MHPSSCVGAQACQEHVQTQMAFPMANENLQCAIACGYSWGDKLSAAPYGLCCCANSLRVTGSDPQAPEAVPPEGSPRWRETARETAG